MYVHYGYRLISEEIDSHITKNLTSLSASDSIFERSLGTGVDWCEGCTLGESDTMGEYLHPHIELETPRVYMHMYMVDKSTKRCVTQIST